MKPVTFPESNAVLSGEDCIDLPVWKDGVSCVSCWELSVDDLIEINLAKRVFVRVYGGQSSPPISVHGEPPFVTTPIKPE